MANIPIINPPDKERLGFCWHHQFTIPLLFDDCLSLLQKVCALWAKLNDVIDALNEFNDEFNVWAKSVEDSLKDLYAKYTALEARVSKNEQDIASIKEQLQSIQTELNDIKNSISNIEQRLDNVESEINDIKQSIENINNSITQIQADMTALEARVKKLEDLLKNLNIIPPIDIYNATDEEFKTGLWQNWWNWLKTKLLFQSGAPVERWEYSANVVWWDTTTHLPRYFQLGRISQPLTLCKLPFVAVCKGMFDHFPTFNEIEPVAPHYYTEAFTPANGFFNFTLSTPFGYTMDEVKFQTSYIPFLPAQSRLFMSDSFGKVRGCKNVNCGVRLQVPSNGTEAKLCVTTTELVMSICPNSDTITDNTKWDMYIYAVAENG